MLSDWREILRLAAFPALVAVVMALIIAAWARTLATKKEVWETRADMNVVIRAVEDNERSINLAGRHFGDLLLVCEHLSNKVDECHNQIRILNEKVEGNHGGRGPSGHTR